MAEMHYTYDLFIAYAHPDADDIRKVVHELEKQEIRIFIASSEADLQPGSLWPDRITKAQEASRITLAFVSEHTQKSHYQKEEITAAIALSGRTPQRHWIVPVFMNAIPDPPPYGLRIVQGIFWYLVQDQDASTLVRQVIKRLHELEPGVAAAGIAPRDEVFGKAPLPGQVFAAELLTQPIHLNRDGHWVQLIVDRRHVRDAVFTNKGKNRLCESLLSGESLAFAQREDMLIHDMLRGTDRRSSHMLRLNRFPLRWASGGVLSIVEIRETEEVFTPFFFRDIPPVGWHISLGASENGEELAAPWKYSFREFFEETMVLSGGPKVGGSRRKRFGEGIGNLLGPAIHDVEAFAGEHIRLRDMEDGLALVDDNEVIPWQTTPTGMSLRLIDPSGKLTDHNSFLVSVNPTELGIETVIVLNYQLSQGDYLLDGEMLQGEVPDQPMKKTLVRMPIALISHRYLREVFGGNSSALRYEKPQLLDERGDAKPATQPSVRPSRPPRPDEIRIFHWDACRRRELAESDPNSPDGPSQREHARHRVWVRNFAMHFFDAKGNPTAESTFPLFTPPSAKAITYYFANGA